MGLLQTGLVKNALESDPVVNLLKRTVPPMDRFLLKATRGWANTGLQTVVLLETVGAKSGQKREIATLCMPMGLDLIVVGSNWGGDRDPAWVHNLRANPEAVVRFRGYYGPVQAKELKGRERVAMWDSLVRYNPQYAVYQEGTSRRIPVMQLTRSE